MKMFSCLLNYLLKQESRFIADSSMRKERKEKIGTAKS